MGLEGRESTYEGSAQKSSVLGKFIYSTYPKSVHRAQSDTAPITIAANSPIRPPRQHMVGANLAGLMIKRVHSGEHSKNIVRKV